MRVAAIVGSKCLLTRPIYVRFLLIYWSLKFQKNVEIRPPSQALLTFKKLVKLYVSDHISAIKTDILKQFTDIFLLK